MDLNNTAIDLYRTVESLELPEWETLEDFARWWIDAGSPIMPPKDFQVVLSDDATASAIFRHKQFQVELYLIFPNPNLPIHGHPGVEVIKMRVDTYKEEGNKLIPEDRYPASGTLMEGQSHGSGKNFKQRPGLEQGFPLLAFQKWDDRLVPTTAAARWCGRTVGPKQEALIKKLYPEAEVRIGWADTTGVYDHEKNNS